MATRKQVTERFAALGVTDYKIEKHRAGVDVDAVSPLGKMFAATDCHTLVVSFYTDIPAAYDAVLEDLASGLIECHADECEMCEEMRGA